MLYVLFLCSSRHGRSAYSIRKRQVKNLKKTQFIVRTIIMDYIHVRHWIPIMIICSIGAQGVTSLANEQIQILHLLPL